jgi:hypothetical protein
MNFREMRTPMLIILQEAIRKALEQDDTLPEGQEKKYGVREYKDFREEADAIEKVLDERSAGYTKIPW